MINKLLLIKAKLKNDSRQLTRFSLTVHCLAVPCLSLPCLALPCLALPCPALPCYTLLLVAAGDETLDYVEDILLGTKAFTTYKYGRKHLLHKCIHDIPLGTNAFTI